MHRNPPMIQGDIAEVMSRDVLLLSMGFAYLARLI